MRRACYAAALAAILALTIAGPASADDHPAFTDGTELYEPGCAPIPDDQGGGELCWDEQGFGPPLLVRVDAERCTVVFDPPHWVWLTVHVERTDGSRTYLMVPPTDATVPPVPPTVDLVPPAIAAPAHPASLPETGATTGLMVGAAITFIVAGAVALLLERRKGQ
jgi:hypothetical protein